ncbi:hypothetical protein [Paraburkholderia aromaticivorans]|uniref:hypothetical protein n=1 Tax=Paraburkholderia aromaticivorans TaxID=2026199 RepID=UPI00145603B2|nr:hypothetical protein [Paraburkholderia aromaticivorans]
MAIEDAQAARLLERGDAAAERWLAQVNAIAALGACLLDEGVAEVKIMLLQALARLRWRRIIAATSFRAPFLGFPHGN